MEPNLAPATAVSSNFHASAGLAMALIGVSVVLSGCPGEMTSRSKSDAQVISPLDGLPAVEGRRAPGSDGRVALAPDQSLKRDQLVRREAAVVPDQFVGGSDIGKSCTSYADCSSGLCAQNTHTGAWFCTQKCNPCGGVTCPVGTGCQNAGIMYICAPNYPNAPC